MPAGDAGLRDLTLMTDSAHSTMQAATIAPTSNQPIGFFGFMAGATVCLTRQHGRKARQP